MFNVLYILRHNPWGIGGGCYACRCYLEAFKRVFADAQLDVCLCAEYLNGNADLNGNYMAVAPRGVVEKLLAPVTGLLHRFDGMARKLLKNKKYDYCIFDHNSIAGPLAPLCKELGVKTIVINHNCEAEYYRDNHGALQRLLMLRHVKKAERTSFLGCDYNIFLTEEDKELFEQLYGHSDTRSMVTGCFDADDSASSILDFEGNRNEKLRLVISGTIGNVQNMDGIQFFLNELLPCVPKDAEVVIAGKNPPGGLSARMEELNAQKKHAQVTLIPNPEDMMSIVSGCDIFICPTRLGGGLKLRVMDGLRAGLPVIAHKVSARGYSAFAKQGMLWTFEDKKQFADALTQVMTKAPSRQQIQKLAAEEFSLEGKVKLLKAFIQ